MEMYVKAIIWNFSQQLGGIFRPLHSHLVSQHHQSNYNYFGLEKSGAQPFHQPSHM